MLEQDTTKARALFTEAGFPDGEGFPTVRLLINRNDQQRVVAQAIAAMWRSVLNIETEIITKNWDEYEAAFKSGDYDVARRGIVMQTTDELTNLKMLFERDTTQLQVEDTPTATKQNGSKPEVEVAGPRSPISEGEALKELRAVPIYFASSFALVKPYVDGFDGNVLDVPSLKKIRMNTNWVENKP